MTAEKPYDARKFSERSYFMDIAVNDLVETKKPHPCGGKTWLVLRVGMDFRLRCTTCGRELLIPRAKAEKSIRRVLSEKA